MTVSDKCGTNAGWNVHVRQKEKACDDCNVAHATYTREWRHRTGRSESVLYTAIEIEEIKREAVDAGCRDASTANLKRRASRIKHGKRRSR